MNSEKLSPSPKISGPEVLEPRSEARLACRRSLLCSALPSPGEASGTLLALGLWPPGAVAQMPARPRREPSLCAGTANQQAQAVECWEDGGLSGHHTSHPGHPSFLSGGLLGRVHHRGPVVGDSQGELSQNAE